MKSYRINQYYTIAARKIGENSNAPISNQHSPLHRHFSPIPQLRYIQYTPLRIIRSYEINRYNTIPAEKPVNKSKIPNSNQHRHSTLVLFFNIPPQLR